MLPAMLILVVDEFDEMGQWWLACRDKEEWECELCGDGGGRSRRRRRRGEEEGIELRIA